MSKVIIVSNRLPVSVKKENGRLIFYPSIGGLATGLAWYVNGRNNRWVGWPGIANDDLTDDDRHEIAVELAKHNCHPVFLNKRQIEEYYNGYSNSILWPLFHGLARGSVSPDLRQKWWSTYRNVNRQFAQAALSLLQTGSRVWVHDYQLMLVPEMLRSERSDIIGGFFLHIPLPASRTLLKLPEAKKLISGVLGADVVGFHTTGYVSNFLDSCRLAEIPVTETNEVLMSDRMVRVDSFPMGIDYSKYASTTKSKAVKSAIKYYRKRYRGRRVIVAIDRLDPSKGLVERLRAYDSLIARNPRLRGKVVFSLVAAPSRSDIAAYKQLSKRLDGLVAEINARHGTTKWQPVDYINRALPFEEVTALFQIADIAFIAPLRDGMNLAAKEFVASKRKNGILILSETAGAAQELPDALLVNPRKPETLVAALEQALSMRRRELRGRLKRMQEVLSTNTVEEWANDFVSALTYPVPGTRPITRTLKGKNELALINHYLRAKRRLLLFDYDGTLVPYLVDYKAVAPPKKLINLLEKTAVNPFNELVLISGRSESNLQEWFGELPVSLVAEHGAAIKKAKNTRWQIIEHPDTKWKEILLPVLERYASLTPGARVEIKPHSLVWHYRGSPPYFAQKYTVIIKRTLKSTLKTYGLELVQGNKILEIKNPRIGKGLIAQNWLKTNPDFILAIGDDATDEDLFKALPDSAYSVKVGRGRTVAQFRLPTPDATIELIKKLI